MSRPVDRPLEPRRLVYADTGDEPLLAGDVRIATAVGPGPVAAGEYRCARCACSGGLRRVETPSGRIVWACRTCLPPELT